MITRIPSLDGWRAVCISLVLVGHLVNYKFIAGEPSPLAAYLALLGVKIFFVISGFLITRLAMSEEATRGHFSGFAFYRRRAFRILPAYFVFLAAVFALAWVGAIQQNNGHIAMAAGFVCNLATCDWHVGHTWSLAFEEQFYLLFPLLFVLVPRALRGRAVVGLLVLVASAPVLSLAWPLDGVRRFIVPFSYLLAGVAFAVHHDKLSALARRREITLAALTCVALCVLVGSGAVVHLRFGVRAAVEALVLPVALAWLLLASTAGAGQWMRLLRVPAVEYVGRMSFSIYLWQQLFTGPPALGALPLWWLLPAAMLSYHGIEQPFIRLGRRIASQTPTRAAAAGAPLRNTP